MPSPGAEEHAQRVRDLYAAFGRGDIPAVRAAFADDVVWHEAGRHEHSGTFHGIDAVLKAVVGSVQEAWQSFSLDVHDVLSNGAHTVALVNWQGTSETDRTIADIQSLSRTSMMPLGWPRSG